MRYLLDTCTISGLLARNVHRKLRTRFHMRSLQSCLASFVVAELRYGALILPGKRGRELLERIEELTAEMEVLPFDAAAARWFAEERARLKPTKDNVSLEDLMIAATAAVHDLVVVTVNVKHFEPLNVEIENLGGALSRVTQLNGGGPSSEGGWFTWRLRVIGCYPHEDTLVTPIIGDYAIPPAPRGMHLIYDGAQLDYWRTSWHFIAADLAESANEVLGWRVEHVIESRWATTGSGPHAVELAASHPLGGHLVAKLPSAHHPDPAVRLWLTADRLWDLLDELAPRSIRNGRILGRAGIKKTKKA